MIEEGINATRKAELQKQDRSFYQMIQKRFTQSMAGAEIKEQILPHNEFDIKINMAPLVYTKIERESEKLLGDSDFADNQYDEQSMSRLSFASPEPIKLYDQSAIKNFSSEAELDKILAGKPITNKIDRSYIMNIQERLHRDLLRDWTVNEVSLSNERSLSRLRLYQPVLRSLIYEATMMTSNHGA